MTGSEFVSVIVFYLVFTLFAGIGFPIVSRFIQNRTLAYVASKPTGLIIFGYLVWVLSYFRVLNYQSKTLILSAFIGLVAVGGYLGWRLLVKTQPEDTALPKKKKDKTKTGYSWYTKILLLEAATLGLLLIYLHLRSFNASINGTERFMDLALLTASGKTDYFPFIDSWYAGKTVNYYYYGSYLMSLLSNLSSIPYAVAYNIALGLIFTQSVVLSAALVFTKTKSKMFAVVAAFLITCAGTVFYSSCVVKESFVQTNHSCSYASSTRLYTPSYIINEIPSYSFTVGDLHAHVLALPFFLLVIILAYALYKQERPSLLLLGIIALAIASVAMINTWDAVTSVCLIGLLMAIKLWQAYGERNWRNVRSWVIGGGLVGFMTGLLMLPNLIGFKSPVLGLFFIPSYVAKHGLKDVQWPTPLSAEIGMWGIFFVAIIAGLYIKRKQLQDWLFPAVLAFLSLGIIVGVELFFVQDIYGITNPPYFRANTTFKFGYHAWTMLSIAFSIMLAGLYYREPNEKKTFIHRWAWLPVAIAVTAGMFYPYRAINQFYLSGSEPRGLDGSLWMNKSDKPDRETINYINKNVTGKRVVIAEAVGDSYTTFARMASYTGMITPMGWKTHEWTWRLDTDAAKAAKIGENVETGYGKIAGVAKDVQTLYETSNTTEAKSIIDKYQIEYIYVGGLETKTYLNIQMSKFDDLAEVVFSSGNSKLYKVK